MVNIYAMGSLLPLSNSSKGRKFSFNDKPRERKMEKTEAESWTTLYLLKVTIQVW